MSSAVLDREADQKSWSTLVARACLRGYSLWRSDAADGPVILFLGRWGMVRALADRAEVERVLEQVGA